MHDRISVYDWFANDAKVLSWSGSYKTISTAFSSHEQPLTTSLFVLHFSTHSAWI